MVFNSLLIIITIIMFAKTLEHLLMLFKVSPGLLYLLLSIFKWQQIQLKDMIEDLYLDSAGFFYFQPIK